METFPQGVLAVPLPMKTQKCRVNGGHYLFILALKLIFSTLFFSLVE